MLYCNQGHSTALEKYLVHVIKYWLTAAHRDRGELQSDIHLGFFSWHSKISEGRQ